MTTTTITFNRDITMPRTTLSESDLASYVVTLTTPEGSKSHDVEAAYSTAEPDWLVFKDHEHRVVAQFNAHAVISAVRVAMKGHPGRVVRSRS